MGKWPEAQRLNVRGEWFLEVFWMVVTVGWKVIRLCLLGLKFSAFGTVISFAMPPAKAVPERTEIQVGPLRC